MMHSMTSWVQRPEKEESDKSLLTVKEWKQIVDEAYAAGMMRVNLTGGECLTYPGFEELYLYLHNKGIETRVLTNGALLDSHWIEFLKAHPPILVQFSLYGGDEDTYERVTGKRGFETVIANIVSAQQAKLPVSVVITPSKYMGEGVFNALRWVSKAGIPYSIGSWLMDPKEETGRAHCNHNLDVDYYRRIYELRNELEGIETHSIESEKLPPVGGPYHQTDICGMTCGAGLSCFAIDWDGKMLACNSMRDNYGWPLKEGFLPVWERLHEISANWIRIPECMECPYLKVCTNCVVQKEAFAERGKQPTKLCEQTKYLVEHGVKAIPVCE